MKGLKGFLQRNKVFIILTLIVLVCVVIMILCLLANFYGGNDGDKYGRRTEGIEKVEITSARQRKIEDKLEADEFISNKTYIKIQGKIIYLTIVFEEGISLVEAQGKAIAILEEYSDEEQNFYDFQFTLLQASSEPNEGFPIAGAKNVHGTNVVWINNTPTAEETVE